MLPSSFLVFLSTAVLTSASPIQHLRKRCNESTTPSVPDTPSPPSTVIPTLPLNGGDTELDSPPSNLSLKHILVGHGIQNYTCASAGATATSTGALAVLWDIEPLYPGASGSPLTAADWAGLPPKVLRTTDLPLNLASSSSSSSSPQYAADPSAPFPPDADLALEGINGTLRFLGHHYFDATGTPTFDLHGDASGPLFKGKKDAGIKAPADADPGLTNSGAVDWLKLSDKGTSQGVSLVYRVYTAGGNPAPCAEAGQTDSVPYATMYWFY